MRLKVKRKSHSGPLLSSFELFGRSLFITSGKAGFVSGSIKDVISIWKLGLAIQADQRSIGIHYRY